MVGDFCVFFVGFKVLILLGLSVVFIACFVGFCDGFIVGLSVVNILYVVS